MSPRRIAKALAGFGAVAVAILLGVTIFVVRSRSSAPTLSQAIGIVPGSLLHAHNFHWTEMKAGNRQWELTARDASYSDDKTSLLLNDADLAMSSEDGKLVRVKAPLARLALDGNHVKRADLSGGTRIAYGDFVLTTDHAVFLPDEDQVSAPGAVTLEGEGMKATGIGLSGHPKT